MKITAKPNQNSKSDNGHYYYVDLFDSNNEMWTTVFIDFFYPMKTRDIYSRLTKGETIKFNLEDA